MGKLPEKIIVLTFNPNRRHKIVLGILKEYFKAFPYILTTLNDGKEYYILPNSQFIIKILNNMDEKLNYPVYFRYESYAYDTLNPRIWDTYILSRKYWGYEDALPDEVTFWKSSAVEALKVLTED